MPSMKSNTVASGTPFRGAPEDPKKRAKYQAIIEAALEAFSEYGYHDCPVSKIARRANVADGTIYLYFANKEEVLISVFREKIDQMIGEMERLAGGCDSPWEKIEKLVRYHITTLGDNRVLANFFQIQLRQSSPKIRRGIAGPLRRLYRLIEEYIIAGQQQGDFDPDLNPNIARKVVFGSIDEVISCWVLSRRKYDVKERIDDTLYVLKRALAARHR